MFKFFQRKPRLVWFDVPDLARGGFARNFIEFAAKPHASGTGSRVGWNHWAAEAKT
jgi:hypothetical protein